jgi:hypothetical protein
LRQISHKTPNSALHLIVLTACDQSTGGRVQVPVHKDKERSAEIDSDSVTSRCSYPDVLRGEPRCEASGTMFRALVASTGQGLGEDGQDERK